jgi:hypothetical protein
MDTRAGMTSLISVGLLVSLGSSMRALTEWLDATPPIWKEKRHRRVRWIEGKIPDGDEAELAWEAITLRGLGTYGEVTRYVADQSFRRDHAAGGWLGDIGLFHPWYLLEACLSLERLSGQLVWIDDGGDRCP